MSIQSEIDRIEQNIANAYSTLSARGATLPAEQNSENLASAINEFEDPVINAHIADKNNPHGVTAEQIGAASKEYVDNAVANVEVPTEIFTVTATVDKNFTTISNVSCDTFDIVAACEAGKTVRMVVTGESGFEYHLPLMIANVSQVVFSAAASSESFTVMGILDGSGSLHWGILMTLLQEANDNLTQYVDGKLQTLGGTEVGTGGSGVAIGPDEPEDGDVWIDTDDESGDSSNPSAGTLIVTADFDEKSETVSNVSHKITDILEAHEAGKSIRLVLTVIDGLVVYDLPFAYFIFGTVIFSLPIEGFIIQITGTPGDPDVPDDPDAWDANLMDADLVAHNTSAEAHADIRELASTQSDWNQNDETKVDYVKNRTHYVIKTHELSYSGPYTWTDVTSTSPGGHEEGMKKWTSFSFSDEIFDGSTSPTLVDISGLFGQTLVEVPMKTIMSLSGINFYWEAYPSVTGYCEVYLYSSNESVFYGQTPTLSNFKTIKKLPEAYIPDTIARTSDLQTHVADQNNPHKVTAEQVGAMRVSPISGGYKLDGTFQATETLTAKRVSSQTADIEEIKTSLVTLGDFDRQDIQTEITDNGLYVKYASSSDALGAVVPIYILEDEENGAESFLNGRELKVGFNEYSDNTSVLPGRIEFYNQEGTIKIGITGDAQEIYDPDADSLVIGLADGDDNPIIMRGVNWPTQPNDATNKEYVDSKIQYGTTDVTAGSASPYSEGTLYVVIE